MFLRHEKTQGSAPSIHVSEELCVTIMLSTFNFGDITIHVCEKKKLCILLIYMINMYITHLMYETVK